MLSGSTAFSWSEIGTMVRRRGLSGSGLLRLQIADGPLGPLSIWRPSKRLLGEVDEHWGASRPRGHQNLHWSWVQAEEVSRDFFAVGRPPVVHALWAARPPTITLLDGEYYRLDRLEVAPDRRGGLLGPVLMGMICWRAVEIGCDGVVAAAFPEVVAWYEGLGTVQECPKGWSHERGLLPLRFDSDRMAELKEQTDALLEVKA